MERTHGPQPNRARALLRKRYPDMSERSFGDFWRAYEMLMMLEHEGMIDVQQAKQLIATTTFQSGRPNVTEFARQVETLAEQVKQQQASVRCPHCGGEISRLRTWGKAP